MLAARHCCARRRATSCRGARLPLSLCAPASVRHRTQQAVAHSWHRFPDPSNSDAGGLAVPRASFAACFGLQDCCAASRPQSRAQSRVSWIAWLSEGCELPTSDHRRAETPLSTPSLRTQLAAAASRNLAWIHSLLCRQTWPYRSPTLTLPRHRVRQRVMLRARISYEWRVFRRLLAPFECSRSLPRRKVIRCSLETSI